MPNFKRFDVSTHGLASLPAAGWAELTANLSDLSEWIHPGRLASAGQAGGSVTKLVTPHGVIRVSWGFKDIVYVEGASNYVIIVSDKQKMCIYKSMRAMDEILSGRNFFRIHNSYIIALDKIHAIKGREVTLPVKDTFRTIPIGITRKAKFLLQLKLGKQLGVTG